MGDYATAADITAQLVLNNATAYILVSEDIANKYIGKHEARLNAALSQMEYDIPLTGTADVALLKGEVVRAVVADLYEDQYPYPKATPPLATLTDEQIKLHQTIIDGFRKQGERWSQAWGAWLGMVATGQVIMPDTAPDARTQGELWASSIDFNYIQEDNS